MSHSWKQKGKKKEIPSCSISWLLIAYTQQLVILATALPWTNYNLEGFGESDSEVLSHEIARGVAWDFEGAHRGQKVRALIPPFLSGVSSTRIFLAKAVYMVPGSSYL